MNGHHGGTQASYTKGMKVTVQAAKGTLSKLIERAHAGEEIVIVRGEVPVATQ